MLPLLEASVPKKPTMLAYHLSWGMLDTSNARVNDSATPEMLSAGPQRASGMWAVGI